MGESEGRLLGRELVGKQFSGGERNENFFSIKGPQACTVSRLEAGAQQSILLEMFSFCFFVFSDAVSSL